MVWVLHCCGLLGGLMMTTNQGQRAGAGGVQGSVQPLRQRVEAAEGTGAYTWAGCAALPLMITADMVI